MNASDYCNPLSLYICAHEKIHRGSAESIRFRSIGFYAPIASVSSFPEAILAYASCPVSDFYALLG